MKKYHKGPSNKEEAAHMLMRKRQNIEQSKYSKAEAWAYKALQQTGYRWTSQAIWGWRVFDFWNHILGIAIEIDGPEHNEDNDRKRDARNWNVSRILVIRVKNFDEEGMKKATQRIATSTTWNERREQAGLKPINHHVIQR
jgi:very-short-patch-repair endonuclease